MHPSAYLEYRPCLERCLAFSISAGRGLLGVLMVGYLLYPLIKMCLENIPAKYYIAITIGIMLLLEYADRINGLYGLSGSYDNVFYRMGEFIIGIMSYEIIKKVEISKFRRPVVLCCLLIIVLALALVLFDHGYLAKINNYSITRTTLNCILIIAIYFIKNKRLSESRNLIYFSKLTYEFYLMQMVAWRISAIILNNSTSNKLKLVTCIMVTLILSVVVKFISDQVRKRISRKGLDNAIKT